MALKEPPPYVQGRNLIAGRSVLITAAAGAGIGFAAATCLMTVLLFGLMPAIQASHSHFNATLKEGGRSPAAPGRRSVHSMVVVAEVALSLVLLIVVGLLGRSFVSLQEVRPGFDAENVVTFRLSLSGSRYASGPDRAEFYDQLEQEKINQHRIGDLDDGSRDL